jgi:hypothetical protein
MCGEGGRVTSIVLRGIQGVSITVPPDAMVAKQALLATAASITTVSDGDSLVRAVEALRPIRAECAAVEKTRQELTAPVLKIQRDLMKVAKDHCADLEAEGARLNGLINGYNAAQARARQAEEAKRQAELARIEAARLAEQQRIEREARQKEDAIRRAAVLEVERSRTAAEKARAELRAQLLAEQQAQQTTMRLQAAEHLASEAARSVVPLDLAPRPAVAGMQERKVPRFEITDFRAAYVARPDLFTVIEKRAAILKSIRGGMRECPGMRIWEENATLVRR